MLETGAGVRVGQLVPDYELLKRVGSGAYGEVWLARSKATGILRAAKIVWRRNFQEERPFQREFEGIQRFERISREHPSQLALFHIGRNEAEGYFYYVMELADNVGTDSDYSPRTLRAELKDGRLPAQRVVEIGLSLAEALEHLHRNGLVHRDVKPSNVIFVNGRPKLADIGLVTDTSDRCSIVGTEGYLPPDGPGTPRADIFALGKVLYEAATGLDRRQFPRLPEDMRSWRDAEEVFEVNEIILKAGAGDPRARYVSAQVMLAELERLDRGESIKQRRAWQRQAAWAWKSFLVAVLGILAVGAVLFVREKLGGPRSSGVFSSEVAANAYKNGYLAMRRGTPNSFNQALLEFTRARQADPKSVAAYARLFETYLMGEDHAWFNPARDRSNKLNELSAELAKLAPDDAETHAANAIILFLIQWKWAEAEREFKKALDKDSGCRMALTYYGYYLTRLDRAREAREVLGRAKVLDATSPLITKFLGHCEFADRHFPEALVYYNRASRLETNYPGAHYWAGRANMAMTNYAQGLNEFVEYAHRQGADPVKAEALQRSLDTNGPNEHWERLLELVMADKTTSPSTYAEIYAQLGDREKALKSLGKAIDQHNSAEFLLFDEFWDKFRGEREFQDLLDKTGLTKALATQNLHGTSEK